jgi:probable F420-dependent oxidoreductase
LGIGSSSNVIVESWNGVPFEAPLARTRDLLRFLRPALAGERVSEKFQTFAVNGFRLENAPLHPPPILVAGLRERMLHLGASEGDGVIVNWCTADDVPKLADIVSDAGGPDKEFVARIFVCPIEDAGLARAAARREITTYLNVPVYAEYMRWLGKGDVLGPMWKAWAEGDRKAANAALPDELVDGLVIHGSPTQCSGGIRRYVEKGVTTPVVRFVGISGEAALTAATALAAAFNG